MEPALSAAPPSRPDALRIMLIEGAIVPSMLKLAAPTILILTVQVLVGVIEVFFIGYLGTEALAGVSLAFPCLMLVQMMSNGGIGAGVSSAVARAIGAGRRDEAEGLLFTTLVLAVGLGIVTTALAVVGGPALFRAMGGRGEALDAACAYAGVVLGGSVLLWTVNLLAAALRGCGDTLSVAVVTLLGVVVSVPLSPLLIFGLGPIPALGVVGAGFGLIGYYATALVFLLAYLRCSHSPVRLRFDLSQFSWRRIGTILAVGAPAAVGTAIPNLSAAIITAAVGAFGIDAIAGYGLAVRLEYTTAPLLFGLGSGIMVMVGANVGAERWDRARRTAVAGALIGAVLNAMVGLLCMVEPSIWLGLFTADSSVLAVGAAYFRVVGPVYGLAAANMLLVLAAQGAGRPLGPLAADLAQLGVGSLGGWLAVFFWDAGQITLFRIVALGTVVSLVVIVVALRFLRAPPPMAEACSRP